MISRGTSYSYKKGLKKGNVMSTTKKGLMVMAGFFYLLTAIFTLTENQVATELCAPITAFLVFLILVSNLPGLGPHKFSTACMGMGFLVIDIYYIFRFFNHYIVNLEQYTEIVGIIYITPSFFFFLNEATFLIYKLKGRRRDLAHLFANSFAVAIIGFVFIYKYFSQVVGHIHNLKELIYLLLIFDAFNVAMFSLQTYHLVGVENLKKGTLITTTAMLIYEIMDIQYIFTQAIGGVPDDYYADLVYMALLIFMTMGITIQVQKKYYFEFNGWSYSAPATRARFIVAIIAAIAAVIMVVVGFLTRSEASYIVIVAMAYIIMTYILKADSLNDELLEYEKRHNAMLEKKVEEQTRDLTKANEKLELLSSTDMLTGLYNRWYAGTYMKNLQEYQISGKKYAFFVIDLNHFKPINDTYGPEMGDKVLEEFGNRMRELPDDYTCFRMGGDEFLIIMKIRGDLENLEDAAENLRKLFNTPIKHNTYVFKLSASIGVSVYPQDGTDIEELLQYADTAMNYVKHGGNKDGYKFFNSGLVHIISTQNAIETRLKIAKPDRDFVLFYQPQVNAQTKEIIGAEVFIHFNGELEKVSPLEVIDAAEECGFMNILGEWIVNTAVRQIASWNEKYHKNMAVTLNISPLQLISAEYANVLNKITKELNYPTSMITLDITNTVIMGASNSSKAAMIRLHEDGYMLSLNDFGGGDINLAFVQDCGIDSIKISRALVTNSVNDPRIKKLVKSIMAIAETLGMTVSAVGIETEVQSENMQSLGVNTLQGYYYGKPVKADAFEMMLK